MGSEIVKEVKDDDVQKEEEGAYVVDKPVIMDEVHDVEKEQSHSLVMENEEDSETEECEDNSNRGKLTQFNFCKRVLRNIITQFFCLMKQMW